MKVERTQGNFIALAGGERFYLDSEGNPIPNCSPVNIDDIAVGLATKCRFNGQLDCFYSVAQHSWILSRICPEGYELEMLLHDAEEVYWCDMPRPWKDLIPAVNIPAEKISKHIWEQYSLQPLTQQLHDMDTQMGHTEAWYLNHQPDWVNKEYILVNAGQWLKRPWEWKEAKHLFLARFEQLWYQRTGVKLGVDN